MGHGELGQAILSETAVRDYQGGVQTMTGIVKWFKERHGYGFIQTAEYDRDVYVHFTDVDKSIFGQTLLPEQAVTFEFEDGVYPRARKVQLAK